MSTIHEFKRALAALKTVHTQEQLKKTRKQVFELRDKLLAESVQFRKEYQRRKKTMQQKAAARRQKIEREAKNQARFVDRALLDIQNKYLLSKKLRRTR